jgi:ferric-dicitrate binding protein FerR (iron transport regulator)
VIPPRDEELTRLFVRYWDNSLSRAESDQLHELLSSDSTARELFQLLSLQAVAAAENTVALSMPAPAADAVPPVAQRRPWSRRQLLGYVGGGVAAGVIATLIGRRFWLEDPPTAIRLTATSGDVRLRMPGGGMTTREGPVPEGGVVTTVGPNSSALLTHNDGTTIALAGDSAVSITERGRRVTLFRGAATASVPARPAESDPLTLATTEASVTRLSSVVFTICHAAWATEVGVQTGRLTVADAVGEPLEVVHSGEYLTIESKGPHRKQSVEPIPDSFALDLSRPLPKGWGVGVRDETDEGPLLLPVLWFDPFHQAKMYQIRSDHRWAKGFVRLRSDSTFRVRYWVEKPGASQFCMCVRTDDRAKSDTGMLECNGAFERARPCEWQWLEVRAEDMRDNKHAPKFAAPWIPFLLIFNTYSEDLGLRIADVRVA